MSSRDHRNDKSPFVLSFEKIVLEDIQKEWDQIEELRAAIETKRELAVIKNKQAQELLQSVGAINNEISVLDAQLSEALVLAQQKRRRSEESLRQLVMEWEREKVVDVADRESHLKQDHKSQVQSLTRNVNKLNDVILEKDHQLKAEHNEVVQQRQLLQEAHTERVEMARKMEFLMLENRSAAGGGGGRTPSRAPQGPDSNLSLNDIQNVSGGAAGGGGQSSSSRQADLEAQVASLSSALKVKDSQVESMRSQVQQHHHGGSAHNSSSSQFTTTSREYSLQHTAPSGGGSAGNSRSPSADVAAGSVQTPPPLHHHHHQDATTTSIHSSSANNMSTNGVMRSLLGLELSNRRQQHNLRGVYIVDVLSGSAAAEAGVVPDAEVIVGWGGAKVNSLADVNAASEHLVPNSFVMVELATPSTSSPNEFESVRRVNIFITGRVEGHHQRKERYAVSQQQGHSPAATAASSSGGITTSTSSSSTRTTTTTSAAHQHQGSSMSRAERIQKFLQEH